MSILDPVSNKVAVLLAAYNGINWLEEQVQTIFVQQDVFVDLFISVDVSVDGTYQWCKNLEKECHNVTVLEYGECFGGAAKNFYRLIRDVDFTGYDYVSLSDQDDVWLPNKLSHAVQLIATHQLDALSSDVVAFWEGGRESLVKKSYPQKNYDYYFEAAGPGCAYVLKVEAMQSFKDFLIVNWSSVNQVDSHDWMIYAYCRSNELQWYIDDVPLMRYRQHESNQVGFNSGLKAYLKRISMVKGNWYRLEVEKILAVLATTGHSDFTLNRSVLVKHFWQLRRRPRDALALLAMLVLGVF
jgi:rhamnosyltransferase